MLVKNPPKIHLKELGFNDTYQLIDFDKSGRITFPYTEWTKDLSIIVECFVDYPKSVLKKREIPLSIEIIPDKDNDGDINITFKFKNDSREFTEGFPANIKYPSELGKRFDIIVCFESKEKKKYQEPLKIGFTLHVKYTIKNFIFKSIHDNKSLEYIFYTGKKLGETWVALDPGTTGSCIVTGTNPDEMIIETDEDGEVITPSVITFNKKTEVNDNLVSQLNHYKFGDNAVAELSLSSVVSFQSFKKLLGYIDQETIIFQNGYKLNVSGYDLSCYLIRGLIRNLQKYVEKDKLRYSSVIHKGKYMPSRAVVAIPNNFTAPKIIDIVNAVKSIPSLQEVRYLSESEAVICYYIYSHSKFNMSQKGLNDETILIFDMGGATINVTIADAYHKDGRYKIDIDSKVGYSVGGDTVDYCLARYFFDFSEDYPDLIKINPFIKGISQEEARRRKISLMPILFDLKKKIIRNYNNPESKLSISNYETRRVLLYPIDIQSAFKSLGVEMMLSNASAIFLNFMEDGLREFPLFKYSYFQTYIYDAIRDAVNDVVELSQGKGGYTDTIIFSGRTTMFPLIKETVQRLISKIKSQVNEGQNISPNIITFSDSELKTAVSKGAYIYGVHRNVIDLSIPKTSSTIGFTRKKSLLKRDFEFVTLIAVGEKITETGEYHVASKSVSHNITKDNSFKKDDSKINFFQVMGIDPEIVIREDQKHKYSKLTQISIPLPVDQINTTVKNDDNVFFETILNTGKIISRTVKLKSQEVSEENEEHYTWIVKL